MFIASRRFAPQMSTTAALPPSLSLSLIFVSASRPSSAHSIFFQLKSRSRTTCVAERDGRTDLSGEKNVALGRRGGPFGRTPGEGQSRTRRPSRFYKWHPFPWRMILFFPIPSYRGLGCRHDAPYLNASSHEH